jgi:hypothetical protein
MKKIGVLFLLMIAFLLFGCNSTTETPKLSTPDNLIYDGLLRWDSVSGAMTYEVYLDEVMHVVSDNFFVIEEEGSYDIKIIAKAPGHLDSDASEILEVDIDYENEVDFTFSKNEDIISWNEVEDAEEYNLFINGTKFVTESASYDISEIDEGVLRITVQAVYPIGVSNVSDIFTIEHDLVLEDEIYFQYSLNSSVDIIIWEEFSGPVYVMNSDGEFMDIDNVLDTSGVNFKILSSFMHQQDYTIEDHPFIFYIVSQGSKYPLAITITNKNVPYIISSSVRETDGSKDEKFQFELFDGTLYSVTGAKDDDISIELSDSVLTIEAEFIADKFEDSDSFVLTYVINVGQDSVLGYLYFNSVE